MLLGFSFVSLVFVSIKTIKKYKQSKSTQKSTVYLYKHRRLTKGLVLLEMLIVILLSLLYIYVALIKKYKPILDHISVSTFFGIAMGCSILVLILDIGQFMKNEYILYKKRDSRETNSYSFRDSSKSSNTEAKSSKLTASKLISVNFFTIIMLFGTFYPLVGLVNSYPMSFDQNFSQDYFYSDSFEDEVSQANPDYWMENAGKDYDQWKVFEMDGNLVYRKNVTTTPDAFSLLHVMGKSIKFEADVKIMDKGPSSTFSLLVRWNHYLENIRLSYDFASQKWKIQEQKINRFSLRTIESANGEISLGQWYNVKAIAVGRSLGLYINDSLVVKAFTKHITYGRIGFSSVNCTMVVDNVDYKGDGDVNAGVREMFIDSMKNNPGIHSNQELDMVELSNTSLILRQGSCLFKSNNDGITWIKLHDFKESFGGEIGGNSIVKLANESMVVVGIERNEQGHIRDVSFISNDGGDSWQGSYPIQETYRNSGSAMNNKLFVTKTGRIFFTTTYKETDLKYGGLRNYYSDDGGRTWNKSVTPLDWDTWKINMQEGKVYELPNGTLRTMVRTDLGVLYESSSFDGGITWHEPKPIPQLISTRCAFNVENDPITGYSFVFWTYENTTKKIGEQYPRERVALAVSRDHGRNRWEYIMDVDDWEDHWYASRYVNLGIKVTSKYIFMNVGVHVEGSQEQGRIKQQRFFRVNKEEIKNIDSFPNIHSNDPFTDSWQIIEGDILI